VIQEAYVQGISTRSVDDLVNALGLGGVSKARSAGYAVDANGGQPQREYADREDSDEDTPAAKVPAADSPTANVPAAKVPPTKSPAAK